MGTCPVCETGITEERPRYVVNLELGGRTRSVDQADAEPLANSSSSALHGQIKQTLCNECWSRLYEQLTGTTPDGDGPSMR